MKSGRRKGRAEKSTGTSGKGAVAGPSPLLLPLSCRVVESSGGPVRWGWGRGKRVWRMARLYLVWRTGRNMCGPSSRFTRCRLLLFLLLADLRLFAPMERKQHRSLASQLLPFRWTRPARPPRLRGRPLCLPPRPSPLRFIPPPRTSPGYGVFCVIWKVKKEARRKDIGRVSILRPLSFPKRTLPP